MSECPGRFAVYAAPDLPPILYDYYSYCWRRCCYPALVRTNGVRYALYGKKKIYIYIIVTRTELRAEPDEISSATALDYRSSEFDNGFLAPPPPPCRTHAGGKRNKNNNILFFYPWRKRISCTRIYRLRYKPLWSVVCAHDIPRARAPDLNAVRATGGPPSAARPYLYAYPLSPRERIIPCSKHYAPFSILFFSFTVL